MTSLTSDENFGPNLIVTSLTRNRLGANHELLDVFFVGKRKFMKHVSYANKSSLYRVSSSDTLFSQL